MDKIKPTRNASGHFPIMHSESGDADSFTGQTVNSFVSSLTLSLKIGGGGGGGVSSCFYCTYMVYICINPGNLNDTEEHRTHFDRHVRPTPNVSQSGLQATPKISE